jgi:hypothetical protein
MDIYEVVIYRMDSKAMIPVAVKSYRIETKDRVSDCIKYIKESLLKLLG